MLEVLALPLCLGRKSQTLSLVEPLSSPEVKASLDHPLFDGLFGPPSYF